MTLKIAYSEGHGRFTAGKRTPADEREWAFNHMMGEGFKEEMQNYDGFQLKLVSDPTGTRDTPLRERTDIANDWKADLYISFHHNANTGVWGTWTGTETYTYSNNPKSVELASICHKALLEIYKLKDRGLKTANFHEVRETNMPAILLEGGYMDSSIDIKVMRDKAKVTKAGKNIAIAVASKYGLYLKPGREAKPTSVSSGTIYRVQLGAFSKAENATTFAEQIKTKTGFTSYLVKSGKVTRVQVGAFSVKKNAEARLKELKSLGYIEAFISTAGTDVLSNAEPNNEPRVTVKAPTPVKKFNLPVAEYWVKSPLFGGAYVREIQKALVSIYFYPDKDRDNRGVDGFYGKLTANAVLRFQLVNGLLADGIYGKKTRIKLDSIVNK